MRYRVAARVALSVIVAITAFGPRAEADKPERKIVRVAKADYQGAGVAGPWQTGVDPCEPLALGCVTFRSRSGEGYVNIDIEDDSGGYVLGVIYVDGHPMERFCSTSHPFVPLPGRKVQVSVFNGPSNDPVCPSTASSGVVIARFMNRP